MKEAVIVSTARTPIGRAYRGAFNDLVCRNSGARNRLANRVPGHRR